MRRFGRKSNKRNTGKVIAAALVGSVVGATVGLLMAPSSGKEMRRKIRGGAMDARERVKTAAGNVESRARELAAEVNDNAKDVKKTVTRRRKVASTSR